jgi:hypothetical protein
MNGLSSAPLATRRAGLWLISLADSRLAVHLSCDSSGVASAGSPMAYAVGFAILARPSGRSENGRSWIRTTDLRLIRAAL